jgi:hypothetical protein
MFGLGPATKIYLSVAAVDMPLSICQSEPHADQSSGLGWERTVGLREAAGEGAVSLAGGGG